MVENSPKTKTAQRMLTEADVLELVPFGRTTLWRKEKDGSFPASTYISKNRHAWFESEVADWQESIKGTGRSQQMKPKAKALKLV
jgi:predicted DNA-binding transcriptional regulator AlpA